METWKDKILSVAPGDICFLTTATTGLSKTEDKLLGVSLCKYNPRHETGQTLQLLHMVPRELILKGECFHHISESLVQEKGLCTEDLRKQLQDFTQDCTIFSYNPEFQAAFLNPVLNSVLPIYDLLLILRGAEARMVWDTEELESLISISKVFRKVVGKVPSLKQFCKLNRIEETPPCSMLPMTYFCAVLTSLWEKLDQIYVSEQAKLF